MTRFTLAVLAVILIANTTRTAHAQYGPPRVNQQRGATVGGIAGAVIGGLIGDNNNEAGAGAAIGGVVGAVAGGVLGNANDKEQQAIQQQRAFESQQRSILAAQQQAVVNQGAISINDVITMSRSGISDSVIMNQINARGIRSTLQVSDIIAMHQQGVHEPVITAMQQAPLGTQVAARPAPAINPTPAPVIVEERYIVPHYAPPRVHHYYPPVRRHHIHFGY